jgi:glycosyltransferase involved in cell wall biosynthesis
MSPDPLVTCLCLTRNRREFLPIAIRSFREQMYSNRELLIVADGENVRDLVPADSRIQYLHLQWPEMVGTKRNIGCAHAHGSVIAHFDDDDYSAPERLSEQVAALREHGKAVTGYHSLTFRESRPVRIMGEDGKFRAPLSAWWLWRAQQAAGTSLCYERSWWEQHAFAAVQAGEDDLFYAAACEESAAVSCEGANRICATNHAGSISGRLIGGAEWEELPGRPAWLSKVW